MLLECEFACDERCPGACRMKCYGYNEQLALETFKYNLGHCSTWTSDSISAIDTRTIDLCAMNYTDTAALFGHISIDRSELVVAICLLNHFVVMKAIVSGHENHEVMLKSVFIAASTEIDTAIVKLTSLLEAILIQNPKRHYTSES